MARNTGNSTNSLTHDIFGNNVMIGHLIAVNINVSNGIVFRKYYIMIYHTNICIGKKSFCHERIHFAFALHFVSLNEPIKRRTTIKCINTNKVRCYGNAITYLEVFLFYSNVKLMDYMDFVTIILQL